MGLLQHSSINERSIAAVINPSIITINQRSVTDARLPKLTEGDVLSSKCAVTLGVPIPAAEVKIVSNHFKVGLNTIAGRIFHYHVHILRQKDGEWAGDVSALEDAKTCTMILSSVRVKCPDWFSGASKFAYDSKSALYASNPLTLPGVSAGNAPCGTCEVGIIGEKGVETKTKFRVTLTLVGELVTMGTDPRAWAHADPSVLRPLDIGLLNTAKWGIVEDNPGYYVRNGSFYHCKSTQYGLEPGFVAIKGYNVGLKVCRAGLVTVVDMAIGCFVEGGPLLDVIAKLIGYRSIDDMVKATKGQFPEGTRRKIEDVIKNCKCKLTHLGHTKKIKGLGPAANSPASQFIVEGNRSYTVDEYYTYMALKTSSDINKQPYREALKGQGYKLKYPGLPCINCGSKDRPVLIPMELVWIHKGMQKHDEKSAAKLVRYAAVNPHDRVVHLMNPVSSCDGNIISVLNEQSAFGVNSIAAAPIEVEARLIPRPIISYRNNNTVDPSLSGEWRMDSSKHKFHASPPHVDGKIVYGITMVTNDPLGSASLAEKLKVIAAFFVEFETESGKLGVCLKNGGSILVKPERSVNEAVTLFGRGAKIGFFVMDCECYGGVKLLADRAGLVTQCLKYTNIERMPRGYAANIMLKVNTKLGGTNHTFKATAGAPHPISWLLNDCMVMGIDVSHPDQGRADMKSVAAVVGSSKLFIML